MDPITPALTLALLGVCVVTLVWLLGRALVVVADHQLGLRIRLGRVVGRLEPGLHVLLPGEQAELHDRRQRLLTVPPQEIASADGVPVKASLSVSYILASPETAREATPSLEVDLHRAAQVALRETLTRLELETLLSARAEVSAGVQELLSAEAAGLGVEIVRAVVLDLFPRGEIKSALAEVVKARVEARARLERTRGETAALRSLANAARLLREHGGLYELRALEAAQRAAEGTSNTLVLGLDRRGLGPGLAPGAEKG